MKDQLVSIIIPTHGNPRDLTRAVDSVLRQTYRNIEIIVVDDNDQGSPDRARTEKFMRRYKTEENVKYITNDRNRERSFTRNHGASHANGTYLMFLDSDDEFLPEKIERQLQCLEHGSRKYGFCYSSYIRKKGQKTVCYNGETREGNLLVDALARNLFIHAGSNLMIKREAYNSVAGFDERLNINEDIDLAVRLFSQGYEVMYCSCQGLIVHLHDSERKKNLLEVTRNYLECEKEIIKKLSKENKRKVQVMMGVQLIRSYSLRDAARIVQIRRKYQIKLRHLFWYYVYLGRRFVKKKSYGIDLDLFV